VGQQHSRGRRIHPHCKAQDTSRRGILQLTGYSRNFIQLPFFLNCMSDFGCTELFTLLQEITISYVDSAFSKMTRQIRLRFDSRNIQIQWVWGSNPVVTVM
jgi:cell division protein FtsX